MGVQNIEKAVGKALSHVSRSPRMRSSNLPKERTTR
jgi:hypothetical protein